MNRKEECLVGTVAPPKATTKAWAGVGSLVLLFLASIAYVSLGGPFANDGSPIFEPETTIAAVALNATNADIALQMGKGGGR
jgi:hypothetical protein